MKEEVNLVSFEDIGFAVGVSQSLKIIKAFHVDDEGTLNVAPKFYLDYLNQFSSSPLRRHFTLIPPSCVIVMRYHDDAQCCCDQ